MTYTSDYIPQSSRLVSRVPDHISEPSIAIIVDRIIRDVSLPIERVKEALSVCREMLADKAKREFDAAFPALAVELPTIEKKGVIDIGRGKPQQYAKLEDIVEAIKPILAAHGFGIRFKIEQNEKSVTAICILAHKGGHREETPFTVPFDTSGSKNIVQAYGSAKSYAQRYALTGALNIVSRGIDDDGHAAADSVLTPAALDVVKAMLDDAGCDSDAIARLCKVLGIAGLEQMTARHLPIAKSKIAEYKAWKAKQ